MRTLHWLQIVLLAACQMSQAESVMPVNFCYENKAIHPWYTGNGDAIPASRPGATIEFLRILDARSPEFVIHYERAPWKRCLYNLELGLVDAVVGSYKPERVRIGKYPRNGDRLDYTRAFEIGGSYCLFVHHDAPIDWDGNQFSGDLPFPIGVPSGYSINDLLKSKGVSIYQAKDKVNALQLVQLKRLSGAALFCEGGQSLLEQVRDTAPDVRIHPIPLQTRNAYLIFGRLFYEKHPELAEEIWHRVARVRMAHYEQIRESYMDK